MKDLSKKKGFTLIELLIVIGVFVIIIATVLNIQGGILADTYLDTNTEQIAQTLRLGQMRSITRVNDSQWGVYFDEDIGGTNDQFVLFNGTTYAARDASYDIVTELPNIISLSAISLNGGGDDVVFEKLSGDSFTYGSILISDNLGNSNTIFVNAKGLIAINETGGGGSADVTAPDAIADLATSSPTTSTVDLDWTAPGDDGATGTATTYDVRYSTSTITEGNWASATQATGEPIPSVAGSPESMTISGLTDSTTYYFAIKTSDEVPNESTISNVSSATTTTPVLNESDYLLVDVSGVGLNGTNKGVIGITIENTGGSNITIATMTVTWTGGLSGNSIKEIIIDGASKWSGTSASGTLLDITDFILVSGAGAYPIDELTFKKSMSGSTIEIIFTMGDASTLTISNIQP